MSDMDYDGLLQLVKKRRSARSFKPDPLPDEYIDKIIEVARWAPSGFHTQPWEFVVVKKKEIRDKIANALRRPSQNTEYNYFRNAPVLILLLGDWRAKAGLPGDAAAQDSRVDSLFCSSLASAFLYLHLAATSLGLASAWVSAVSAAGPQEKIKKILGIPEALRIYDLMLVGHQSHSPVPKVLRDKENVVHYDDAGQYRTDAQVIADAEQTRAWCISAHRNYGENVS